MGAVQWYSDRGAGFSVPTCWSTTGRHRLRFYKRGARTRLGKVIRIFRCEHCPAHCYSSEDS